MATTNEITPEGSVVPVFLEPLSAEEQALMAEEQERIIAEQHLVRQARESAIAKLTELGLTVEELNAIIA